MSDEEKNQRRNNPKILAAAKKNFQIAAAKKRKRCTDGINVYESITLMTKTLRIGKVTCINRLKSDEFPEWRYITDDEIMNYSGAIAPLNTASLNLVV